MIKEFDKFFCIILYNFNKVDEILNLRLFDFLTKLINNNEEIMKKTLDGSALRKLRNIVSKSF
jgi:hypothetical protein